MRFLLQVEKKSEQRTSYWSVVRAAEKSVNLHAIPARSFRRRVGPSTSRYSSYSSFDSYGSGHTSTRDFHNHLTGLGIVGSSASREYAWELAMRLAWKSVPNLRRILGGTKKEVSYTFVGFQREVVDDVFLGLP